MQDVDAEVEGAYGETQDAEVPDTEMQDMAM